MLICLLVPLLLLGAVDSHDGNGTSTEATAETHKVGGSTLETITMNPSNVTTALYKDEKSWVKNKLRKNLTLEDDENFQKEEDQLPAQLCNQHNMSFFSNKLCVEPFRNRMVALNADNWCNREIILEPYHDMTQCIEIVALYFSCFYPNQVSHGYFISVHSSFFQNCTKEEEVALEDAALEDAPQWLVVTLTLMPVSLIPVLTYVVAWNSKVQE